MWEDEANVKGGKWMIRLKKGLISRCWENLILAVLGEQFIVGNEICGAVASMRYQVSFRYFPVKERYQYIFLKLSGRYIIFVE